MNIGIIGLGVVGSACKAGFEKIGHNVKSHDIKLYTKIEDVLDTEICFISVPTPANNDWSCNTMIVEEVVEQMNDLKYDKPLCIKSTIEPGTIKKLRNKFPNLKLYFVPEFLRERCAEEDSPSTTSATTYTVQMKASEAELVKYFSNSYKALRITFANSFYELCEKLDANYDVVKDAFLFHGIGEGHYLNVNKEFGGFGGTCLPKDTKGLAYLSEKLGLDLNIFKMIVEENEKFVTKVPQGMRREI